MQDDKKTQIYSSFVKIGYFCMIKGFPCRVTDNMTSKPGKHGAAKSIINGYDIFTKQNYIDSFPDKVQLIDVKKNEYQVIDINGDDIVKVILQDKSQKQYLLPLQKPDVAENMKNQFPKLITDNMFCTVIRACGEEKIVDFSLKAK